MGEARVWLAVIALAWLGDPTVAWAHPLIDQAAQAYEEASFEASLELLARAEAADDLSRDDLIALIRTRALVYFALGSVPAMTRDVERLAALDPNIEMPAEAPPTVRNAFADARTRVRPLRLTGDVERVRTGARFRARIAGDPEGLVRRTEVSCRVGESEATRARGESLDLRAETGDVIRCHAVLVGVGGATLASVASPDAPLTRTLGPFVAPGEGDSSAVPYLLVGGGLAVASAVVVWLILSQPEPRTIVEGPTLGVRF